jgi:glycine cleavage system regulatory protein
VATLVLTVVGEDRTGLVQSLSAVVAAHGGNWERSRMAELAGTFAGIVLVTVPDAAAEALRADLDGLRSAGLLDVRVDRAPGAHVAARRRLRLDLVGTDRPGIVHEISEVLATHGVSIEELETATSAAPMAGGTVFEARAVLAVTEALDDAQLRRAVEALADELMVEITLGDDPA